MRRTAVTDLANGMQARVTDKAVTFVHTDGEGVARKVRVELSSATLDELRGNEPMLLQLAELFCTLGVEADLAGKSPVIASAIFTLMGDLFDQGLTLVTTAFVAADMLEEIDA